MQRPTFASLVVAMMLVMGIPAIFLALVVKSQYFDKDRYEFDPNKTWSVLEQGRGFHDVKEADDAVKLEMGRLALERKNLVDSVKKLDEAMLALRAVAGTSPAVAQTIPNVLERLAKVRSSVGVDGPQQLMDFTAPPVDLAAIAAMTPAPAAAMIASAAAPAMAAPAGGPGRQRAVRSPDQSRDRDRPRAAAAARRDASPGRPPSGLDPGQAGRAAPRDVQRRQPLREDRRPGRELHRLRRARDGLRRLPSDRRRLGRRAGLYLRDGQHAQGAGQVRRGEARGAQAAADRVGRVRRGREHDLLLGPVLHPGRRDERRRQVRRLRPRAGPADRREAGAQARGVGRVHHGRIRR